MIKMKVIMKNYNAYIFFLSLQPSGLNQVGGNLPIKRYSTNRAPATQGYCMTVVIIT